MSASTVTIPINSFQYTFRKLTFEEELALEVKSGEDGARIVLTAALVEVSGRSIGSRSDSKAIVGTFPSPVLERIWIMYKAGLPADRFFTAKGLYLAPEPSALVRRSEEEQEHTDHAADRAVAALRQRFGHEEVAEAEETGRRLLEDARRRGVVTKASSESLDG